MTRKTIYGYSGNSGRINVSGSELELLDARIGDDIGVDVVDTKDIAQALIDSKGTDRFLGVTPL